ncbi:MAG: F0F1 ATP synthase subunit B [Chloroflexi bacterium]|nr:F0F1 ATP synthase subunit B [Chloroflexota bacterium]
MIFLAEGGIGALGINLPSLIAQLINFTLLLIVLGWAFKRFLFPLLDERRKRIQEGLEASEEAKQRLSQTETETAAELEKARQEGQGLIGQAQQMSARIQEEARQSARAEGETLLERARSEIQLERDAAIADLRREFADLTITAAERVIRRSLDRKAHRELIEEVLAEAPQGGDGKDGQT